MNLDGFITLLVTGGVVVLGVVVTAFLLNKAGIIGSLWDIISKIFDWIISGFQAIVFSAPGPIKAGIFLLLFSVIGAVVFPYTLGIHGVCLEDELWVTDSLSDAVMARVAEIGAGQTVQGMPISRGDLGNGFFRYGPFGALSEKYGDFEYLVADTGALVEGEEFESNTYYVCRWKDQSLCYVTRPVYDDWLSAVTVTDEEICQGSSPTSILLTRLTPFGIVENAIGDFEILSKWEYEYRVLPNSVRVSVKSMTMYDSLEGCRQVEGVTMDEPVSWGPDPEEYDLSWWQEASYGLFKDVDIPFWKYDASIVEEFGGEGYVVGTLPTRVVDNKEDAAVRSVDIQKTVVQHPDSGFTKVDEEDQEGALQFQCEGNQETLTLYGLPVFTVQVMFLIVVVFGLIWFYVKR